MTHLLSSLKSTPNIHGALLILLSALFALMGNGVLHSMSQDLPAVEILFFKSLVAFISLLVLCRSNLKSVLKTNALAGQILRGALATIGGLAWITSILHLPLAETSALSLTSAFFTAIGGVLFFKEKTSLALWGSLAVGFFGVLIILQPTGQIFSFYAFLPLVSALAFSGSSLIIKPLGIRDNQNTTLLYSMGVMAILSFIPTCCEWTLPTYQECFKLLAIGFFYMLNQKYMVDAYIYAAASFIAPFKFVRFPLNTIVGFLFFIEIPPLNTFIGGLLIVISCIYLIWTERKNTINLINK